MNYRSMIGIVLIILGVYLFMNRGETFSTGTIFYYFWPSMFVIPVGIFFHWLYFTMIGRGVGLLIPGGIFLTAGIVCQIAMLFNYWGQLWPGFILAVAVGLFEFYWFGSRSKWLLIPINILSVLSLLFFIVFSIGTIFNELANQPIIAITMIILGLMAIFVRKKEG